MHFKIYLWRFENISMISKIFLEQVRDTAMSSGIFLHTFKVFPNIPIMHLKCFRSSCSQDVQLFSSYSRRKLLKSRKIPTNCNCLHFTVQDCCPGLKLFIKNIWPMCGKRVQNKLICVAILSFDGGNKEVSQWQASIILKGRFHHTLYLFHNEDLHHTAIIKLTPLFRQKSIFNTSSSYIFVIQLDHWSMINAVWQIYI